MITIQNLHKEYGSKVILRGADLHFPKSERIALVGPNGVGKTTLLHIICGDEEASLGQVNIPSSCKIGHLPQEPNQHPRPTIREECLTGAKHLSTLKDRLDQLLPTLSETHENVEKYAALEEEYKRLGGYEISSKAERILLGLGFKVDQLEDSPATLSGGWRMRLELAKLFVDDPDFLILDEPTNHLDLPSLMWVESYLLNFKGTLLFVSHDQDLLDKMATMTIEMKSGRLTLYKGNFSSFLEQRAEQEALASATLEQIEKKKKHMQSFVDRFGAKATKAKQAQSRVKMIEKLQALETGIEAPSNPEEMAMAIPRPQKSGREVLTVTDGRIGYGDLTLQSKINVRFERGTKVAIIGSNGIGKSTFLKTICNQIPSLSGSFQLGHEVFPGYFAQDQLETLDMNQSVLDNVLASNSEVGEAAARKLLGSFLFHGEDVFKAVRVLSGGEKSRVGLAATLVKKCNLLILDEPTNHLDMSSVQTLISALGLYEGTLIFVSHNRSFINGICSHVLAMTQSGESLLVEGDLDSYQRMAAVSGFPDVLNPAQEEAQRTNKKALSDSQQHRAREKQKQKQKNRQKKIETEIENLAQKKEKLAADLNQVSPSDFLELTNLQEKINTIETQIADLEAKWLEAEEALQSE